MDRRSSGNARQLGQEMKVGLAVIAALVVIVVLVVVKRIKDSGFASTHQEMTTAPLEGGAWHRRDQPPGPHIVGASPASDVMSPAPSLLSRQPQGEIERQGENGVLPRRVESYVDHSTGAKAREMAPESGPSMADPSSTDRGEPSTVDIRHPAWSPQHSVTPDTRVQGAGYQHEGDLLNENQPNEELASEPKTPSGARTIRTVARDSFWTIAQRVYGDSGYFKALYEYNRFRFPSPDRVVEGEVVEVPDLSQLHRLYPRLCPQRRQAVSIDIPSPSARLPDASVGNTARRVYTVQPGETLMDIAGAALGRRTRWIEIYRLNSDRLKDHFERPPAGMQLMLPEKTAYSGGEQAPTAPSNGFGPAAPLVERPAVGREYR